MNKTIGWLAVILAVLLILPLIGVTQLGTLTSGALAWIIALIILVIGILQLTKKK